MYKTVTASINAKKNMLKKKVLTILLKNTGLFRDAHGPNCYYKASILNENSIGHREMPDTTSIWNTYGKNAIAHRIIELRPKSNQQ